MKKKRVYKTVSCHGTKTDAKKVQKRMHNAGKTAVVVKTKVGVKTRYCVKSAGNKKK